MRPSVKNFIQTHRDLINNFEFRELYSLSDKYFDSNIEKAEFWSILKQTASKYISYRNILPKYEEYFDLNNIIPRSDDFTNLNKELSFTLPISSYHELLKTLAIEYPNKMSPNYVEKHLNNSEDRQITQCIINIDKIGINSNATINISFNLDNQWASQTLDLESIRKSNLNWVPGLCMGVNISKIEQQMQEMENNLLLSLDEARKEK